MKTRFYILIPLFIILLLNPAYAAASTLTVKLDQSTLASTTQDKSPVKVQAYFYNDQGQVLKTGFKATSYDNQDKPVEIHSGDSLKISVDHPLVVKDIPDGTGYRVTLIENYWMFHYEGDKVCLSGKVNGDTENKFAVSKMGDTPDIYPVFNVETESPNLETLKYTFEISLKDPSQESNLTYPKRIETTGPGYVCVPMNAKRIGTYELQVKQTNAPPGVKIDETVHTLILVVNINEEWERPEANIDYDSSGNKTPPTFVNTEVTPVTYAPRVQKVISGETPSEDDSFIFRLSGEEENSNVKLPQNKEIHVKAGKYGDFDPISFSAPGNYNFQISEVETGLFGFTYDTNTWKLTVPVTETESGLTVQTVNYESKAQSNSEKATFTNTYNSGNLKISKTVTGKEGDETPFKFTLSLQDNKGTNLTGNYPTDKEDPATVTNGSEITLKDGESITIKNLPEGSKYSVTETTEEKGYTKSSTGESGDIRKGETSLAQFTNSYLAAEASFRPKVKKTLTGETPSNPETFNFKLAKVDEDSSRLENTDLSISGSGEQEFGSITFSQPGTYHYTIIETSGSATGYSYDQSSWNLEVVVEDHDAELQVVKHTYIKNSGNESSNEEATFTNNYTPTPVDVTPKVTKAVEGNAPESLRDFKFKITETDDVDGDDFSENQVTVQGAATEATFTPIHFTKAGTYNYTISEVKGEGPFTYDETQWTLTVVVTDNAGILSAQTTYMRGEDSNEVSANFINTYLSGSLSLQKIVEGKEEPTESFKFKINLKYNGQPLVGSFPTDQPELTLSDGGSFNLNHNQTIKISDLPIGTEYTLSEEEIPNGYTPNFVNSNTGKITQENHDVTVTCTNVYKPSPTSIDPTILKQISGDKPTSDSTFHFTLSRHDGSQTEGDSLTEPLHVEVTGEKQANFSTITFNKTGTYQYDITEDVDDLTGYTFDNGTVTLTVTVIDTDGALGVQSQQYQRDGEPEPDPEKGVFTNTYRPVAATYTPKVEKTIDGETPFDSEFTFTITAKNESAQGNLPEPQTCTVTGSSEGSFPALTFSHAGTFQYTITENNGELPGYDYDLSQWLLEVKVEDQNGTLNVVSHNYSVSNEIALSTEQTTKENQIEINNTYKQEEQISSKSEPSVTQVLSDLFGLTTAKAAPLERKGEISTGANFNNGYKSGTLKITKRVIGESTDTFKFDIHLKNPDGTQLTGLYPTSDETQISDGSTFTLMNNQSIEIRDLPVGTQYEVSEEEAPGYKVSQSSFSGSIDSEDSVNIEFQNEREEAVGPTGGLRIEKIVEGEETSEKFKFTLTLKDQEGKELNGNYKCDNGQLISSGSTFELGHGESLTINGIPEGTNYEVTEEENEKYKVVALDIKGTVSSQTDKTAKFVNQTNPSSAKIYHAKIPKTGDNLLSRYAIIIMIVLTACIYILSRNWRKSR